MLIFVDFWKYRHGFARILGPGRCHSKLLKVYLRVSIPQGSFLRTQLQNVVKKIKSADTMQLELRT